MIMPAVSGFVELPFQRNGQLIPGLPVLQAGVERHPVPGGGSRGIAIEPGDQITVIDWEGLQPAEVIFFSDSGESDPAMLGLNGAGESVGLQSVLMATHSGKIVLEQLRKRGLLLDRARASRLFSEGSRAGDRVVFTAEQGGLMIVCAPGDPMLPDQQNCPTELVVYVERQRKPQPGDKLPPPDPLADPLADKNINPGEAFVYTVKAGDYIQILDVQGRECSDFQAFSMAALDKGLEREIDPTMTRSMTGTLYPAPGLFAKYYSVDQEPLIEIVQDTCGRHDTFGVACTARYYEDLGYPGHVNCSDNMNRELASHAVKPRGGWPAINFFFNTLLDDTNLLGMDDPWSRPGDYVLLRAMTDLVCVSTACPCDVDPANAWNPTDIQVRVYDRQQTFSRSIGWRKTPEKPVETTRETGFHDSFARFTRDFVEYNGYWLPNTITQHGAINEYWACREKAAIMDLSPLRKYEVTGPDAETLMQHCVTRDISKLSVGQVVYTAMCYEHGGMIDDGTVYRLGENNFRWVGGNDDSGLWLRQQAEEQPLNAWVRSSTDQLCNIAIQGPLSRSILDPLIWTPPAQPTVSELGWFRMTIGRLGDFHGPACVVSRTGYSGELGYEIFCHPDQAAQFFDAVWEAGEPEGLLPLGLEALNLLRVEAGLIFAGYEFSDQIDPFEAGIGFTVPLKSKAADFVGREALQQRKEHPQRKLVGLDIEGGLVPATGDCVRIGKAQVGEITSAVKSPFLGKVIALARVDVVHADVGTEIEVGQLDGLQKRLKATVVPFPHFDPGKERVRGNYQG